MSLFRNRHIIIALVVAPILAVVAWLSVDYLFGERPQAAVSGQSYPLVEMPGCRYGGGACGLKNADFELLVTLETGTEGAAVLQVDSAFPLDGVVAALVSAEAGEREPGGLRRVEPGGRSWAIDLAQPPAAEDRLRIVASAEGAKYFGEVSTRFVQPPEPSGRR
jgi:hypothetical protein